MKCMSSIVARHRWPCAHKATLLCSNRSLSSYNFREQVHLNKQNARKFVVVENLCHRPDVNTKIKNVNTDFLSDKLGIGVDSFWSWSYNRRAFFLLQLNSARDVRSLQDKCGFNLHSFPVRSRMLEMSFELPDKSDNSSRHKQHYNFNSSITKMPLSIPDLKKQFTSQGLIEHFTSRYSLSPLDIQLRYFLISQLEDLLCNGVFSGFHIYPFGSSLAGLGEPTSDLDICLLHNKLESLKSNFSMPPVKSERDLSQQSLCLIADVLRHFTPNFSQINRILRARVPIVKTTFDLAPIDMDISIELSEDSGHHGFIMASYMSYCVDANPLVKQLFVFLKNWAKQHGLVKSTPGAWFSNFQIITLAIYFLQSKNILQSMETYKNSSIETSTSEQPSFAVLLYEFFEFLVSFNFEKEAISILQAKTFSKPDYAPIYVENPIERTLNIFKNLNGLEFKKLVLVSYNSLDAMNFKNWHLADLLDPEYFKQLEKQTQSS